MGAGHCAGWEGVRVRLLGRVGELVGGLCVVVGVAPPGRGWVGRGYAARCLARAPVVEVEGGGGIWGGEERQHVKKSEKYVPMIGT